VNSGFEIQIQSKRSHIRFRSIVDISERDCFTPPSYNVINILTFCANEFAWRREFLTERQLLDLFENFGFGCTFTCAAHESEYGSSGKILNEAYWIYSILAVKSRHFMWKGKLVRMYSVLLKWGSVINKVNKGSIESLKWVLFGRNLWKGGESTSRRVRGKLRLTDYEGLSFSHSWEGILNEWKTENKSQIIPMKEYQLDGFRLDREPVPQQQRSGKCRRIDRRTSMEKWKERAKDL
jgi:uncharacterized protein YggL (DUF469 family)